MPWYVYPSDVVALDEYKPTSAQAFAEKYAGRLVRTTKNNVYGRVVGWAGLDLVYIDRTDGGPSGIIILAIVRVTTGKINHPWSACPELLEVLDEPLAVPAAPSNPQSKPVAIAGVMIGSPPSRFISKRVVEHMERSQEQALRVLGSVIGEGWLRYAPTALQKEAEMAFRELKDALREIDPTKGGRDA